MSYSSTTQEQGTDSLAPLEQIVRWFLSTTIHVALGLAVGLIAARLMRTRQVHWTWAAMPLPPILLAYPGLAGPGSTLGIAALSAAAWGRRWHREDLDTGSDVADLAASRRRPFDTASKVARLATLRWRRGRKRGGWFRGEELVVGHDQEGRAVMVPFARSGGGVHSLVVGATGSGKTVTLTWIAARAIEGGMGAVVVDPKGDRDLRGELLRVARSVGRAFMEWSPGGPSVYNPYARGSDTEIADKTLAGERFTEPHYLRQAQRYLGHVVRVLRSAEIEVSARSIVEHMDPVRLECLARDVPEDVARHTHDYLDAMSSRQQSDLAGVRDRLAILSESDVGPWLDPQTIGAQRLDLADAARDRAVVYFGLESDSRPLLTQMLGAAIVQDVQTTVAALQGRPTPTLIVIDEFSAVAAQQVVRLFGRARSAGFSLLLGTQELCDLRLPGRERLLEQVMGNLSLLIAHRQVVPESAELIASLAGTKGVWRVSRHSDGRTTRTRGREGVLRAEEITTLGVGWGAVVVLAGSAGPRFARICRASSR